jgi:hypothetical protein
MKDFWLAASTGVLAVSLFCAPLAGAQPVSTSLDELRQGGYIFLFQNAHVISSTEQQPLDPGDCAAQLALTPQGRADAAAVGEAFRTLLIPVGPVLTSPYCRALETGRLAFGRAEAVEPLLNNLHRQLPGAPPIPEWPARLEASRRMLTVPPAPGTNVVLITHGGNILRMAGFEPGFAGALVFRPDGRGGTERVAITARWPGTERRPDAPVVTRPFLLPAELVALASAEPGASPSTLPAAGKVPDLPLDIIRFAVGLLVAGMVLRLATLHSARQHRRGS